jgi:hypothetical protein
MEIRTYACFAFLILIVLRVTGQNTGHLGTFSNIGINGNSLYLSLYLKCKETSNEQKAEDYFEYLDQIESYNDKKDSVSIFENNGKLIISLIRRGSILIKDTISCHVDGDIRNYNKEYHGIPLMLFCVNKTKWEYIIYKDQLKLKQSYFHMCIFFILPFKYERHSSVFDSWSR